MQIDPMLPETAENPFDDERYIFEPKIDGLRLLLTRRSGVVRLFARHRTDVTAQYPELCRVPSADNADLALDGVAASFDSATGTFSRDAVRERQRLKKGLDIREASVRRPLHFFAFDMPAYREDDLRGRPLRERRALLSASLEPGGRFVPLFAVEAAGRSLFEAIRGEGVEGIVAKRLDSPYAGGRSANWLAIRKYRYADVGIAGYRKHGFGWLLEREGRRVGVLEAGIPLPHRQALLGVAKAIATDEDRDFVYVRPVIRARIRYLRLNRSGGIDSPEFVRFVV